jgi:hypothetical protein
MEKEAILRIILSINIIFFILSSCGIKGSPLPPESSKNELLKMPVVELNKN